DTRDIREQIVPALMILGDKDTLVPVAVMTEFKKMFPNNEQLILEKTGHAPFITAAEKSAESVKNFIHAK
ncbi:MAG: alpha/beta hydrolase, partial [Gammaproteobacteria bacterium]|nr:alpha/beta hydrolase [Gammaproteobacteria bacterium]